jgi:hypothetical protein
MVRQDTADRLGGDAFDNALVYELSGQFQAIPLGEGPAKLIRSLAGHLNRMYRHRGGKTGWQPRPGLSDSPGSA